MAFFAPARNADCSQSPRPAYTPYLSPALSTSCRAPPHRPTFPHAGTTADARSRTRSRQVFSPVSAPATCTRLARALSLRMPRARPRARAHTPSPARARTCTACRARAGPRLPALAPPRPAAHPTTSAHRARPATCTTHHPRPRTSCHKRCSAGVAAYTPSPLRCREGFSRAPPCMAHTARRLAQLNESEDDYF